MSKNMAVYTCVLMVITPVDRKLIMDENFLRTKDRNLYWTKVFTFMEFSMLYVTVKRNDDVVGHLPRSALFLKQESTHIMYSVRVNVLQC